MRAQSKIIGLRKLVGTAILVAGITAFGVCAEAAEPATPKASAYAPAADLAAQVDYYLGRMTDALADKAGYDADKQKRVSKDANTLAAIALVLGQHDQKSKYQAPSAAIIKAAQGLADAAEDYDKSQTALAELKTAVASGAADPVAWGEVASLAALMQQVPIVNNSLRRSLEPGKFKKQAALAAEQAATLAAIAQASWFDTSSVAEDSDTPAWRKFCEEMRDAAADVNSAAHRGDQPAAAEAAKRLALSCDGCHAKFRN
jgi:hypothetical protein